jgi:D-serine deaminase-like pyridoxal phosphate-dependent protein
MESPVERIAIDDYFIAGIEHFMTPALTIYPAQVEHNIQATLRLLGGDVNRWRPHVKTAKLANVIERLVAHNIVNMKCATTLELLVACEAGVKDVLLAYPCVGSRAARMREIAAAFPEAAISALADSAESVSQCVGSRVDLFIDVNPGMDRTGIDQNREVEILQLARSIREHGIRFRGLHYYDGHVREEDLDARTTNAHRGHAHLMRLIEKLGQQGTTVEEVITSGTPSFPCALSYHPFTTSDFIHRISPGTIVYNDLTSLAQLPTEFGYRPAALVIATVVSRPAPDVVTCDAGHKKVSADAGYPTCAVLGWPDLEPLQASEEHLPLRVRGNRIPKIGDILYLIPKHVCPTVNNFDHALFVDGGKVVQVVPVSARGREGPDMTRSLSNRLAPVGPARLA